MQKRGDFHNFCLDVRDKMFTIAEIKNDKAKDAEVRHIHDEYYNPMYHVWTTAEEADQEPTPEVLKVYLACIGATCTWIAANS